MHGGLPVLKQCTSALQVFLLDKKIRAWLEANDPMALKQADKAVTAALADWQHPDNPVHAEWEAAKSGKEKSNA
jgi:hypothetical protein